MNRRRLIRLSAGRALAGLVVIAPLAAGQRGGGAPATPPTQANVAIPVRDGTQLGADVYLPPGQGPFPVLLTITPYGKNGSGRGAAAQLARGYAVVAVDSRGLRASKGKWEPYIHEAQDGYDIQQWVGHQPWCNGNIGMFGTSYPAYTQVAPAQYRSPYVKALVPVSAQSDNYGSVWASDGIFHLAFGPKWAAAAGGDRREQAGAGRRLESSGVGAAAQGDSGHDRCSLAVPRRRDRARFARCVLEGDEHSRQVPRDGRARAARHRLVRRSQHGDADQLHRNEQSLEDGDREALAAAAHRPVGPRRSALPRRRLEFRRRRFRTRREDRLSGDVGALVRLPSQGNSERRRQGSAGEDLRDGREQVARRTGVAARPCATHPVLLPQQRLGELAVRRWNAEHRGAGERAARQIPLRSAQPGSDVRWPWMLRLRLRGDGPARPARDGAAPGRPRVFHGAARPRTPR